MIAELDIVIMTEPLTAQALEKSDVGTAVHVFGQGEAYEVEFLTLQGATDALVTVNASQLRPVGQKDLLHVREWNAETSKLAA